MLKVGLGDFVLGELGDLGVVHLDVVDADEILDDAPRPLVESVQRNSSSHRLKIMESIECVVVPKGEIALQNIAESISIFYRYSVIQNVNKK